MDVVVYSAARRAGARKRLPGPVFAKGASATDKSLIGAGDSLVVENNYGYTGAAGDRRRRLDPPGLERVDVDAGGGCRKVWRSDEQAPSVVPKLSLGDGLVYTYTKPPRGTSDPWYLTALDFRTGRTVFAAGRARARPQQQLRARDARARRHRLRGMIGGLVALRDTTPPAGPPRARRAGCSTAPRLKLIGAARQGEGRILRRCAPAHRRGS